MPASVNSKYFIAILVKGAAGDLFENIKQEIFTHFNLKAGLRCHAHITLHRPFEWPEHKEKELVKKLSLFTYSGSNFPVYINGTGNFDTRVIFAKVEQSIPLTKLQEELKWYVHKNIGLFNETADLRGFHPHITLAFRDLKKRHFQDVYAFVESLNIKQNFLCHGFSLLKFEEKWGEIAFFPFNE